MKKVFICSPYRGDTAKNEAKAFTYCWQAIAAGCMPYAPHLYFTQFLDDNDPEQRGAGMDAGLEWLLECIDAVARDGMVP